MGGASSSKVQRLVDQDKPEKKEKKIQDEVYDVKRIYWVLVY